VRQWRAENPGYWRSKVTKDGDALQDVLMSQGTDITEESGTY